MLKNLSNWIRTINHINILSYLIQEYSYSKTLYTLSESDAEMLCLTCDEI